MPSIVKIEPVKQSFYKDPRDGREPERYGK